MKSAPKIIVFKTREIIYTLLLLSLVALLILCLILMFSKKSEPITQGAGTGQTAGQQQTELFETGQTEADSATSVQSDSSAGYTPGVYTTPITLGDATVDVEVTVDANHINGIRLVNLSETTAASFPLVSPSLEHIASQILEKQKLDGISCPQENRYTSQLLLSAISDALDTARK